MMMAFGWTGRASMIVVMVLAYCWMGRARKIVVMIDCVLLAVLSWCAFLVVTWM